MADFLNFILFCFLVFSFLAPLGASQGKRLMTAALLSNEIPKRRMNMFYIKGTLRPNISKAYLGLYSSHKTHIKHIYRTLLVL
jgi:hypothetical protein